MKKAKMLALHGLVLVGLLVVAVMLATWRGDLFPVNIGFSTIVAAGGLAVLLIGWGPIWLLPVAVAAAAGRIWQRLALWVPTILGMIAIHALIGTRQGFAALETLTLPGAFTLYAIPVALALLLGSALREAFRREPGTRAV